MTDALALSANETPFGVGAALRWAVVRDLRLALRSRAELGVQLLFYVIVVSLFPLASSPERTLLATMGPGVIWVAALLASLLSLPRLFASDFTDGTLEQIALSPFPLPALVSGKILAHWLTTGLPIVVLAPMLGLQYGLDARDIRHRHAGAADRHADSVAAGGHRCRAHAGGARRRQPARAARAAAVRAGADLRRRGRRCGARRIVGVGASVVAGGRTVDRAGRRAACRPPPPCALRSTDERLPIFVAGHVLSVRGAARAVVRRRRRRACDRGSLDRLRHRAHRLPARRGVSDHLHPRARRVDVDVHLSGDGVLGRARARVQYAAVGDDGAGARADRRADDVHRAVDRCAVGPPDVGHVLGVGRAHDLRARSCCSSISASWRCAARSTTRAARIAPAPC